MSLLSDIMETVYPTISKDFRQQESMCICVEWKSCQLDLYFAKGCFGSKTFFSVCGRSRNFSFPSICHQIQIDFFFEKYFSHFLLLFFPSKVYFRVPKRSSFQFSFNFEFSNKKVVKIQF